VFSGHQNGTLVEMLVELDHQVETRCNPMKTQVRKVGTKRGDEGVAHE
jgi:hypothetical protein